jgi:hypothetical protein
MSKLRLVPLTLLAITVTPAIHAGKGYHLWYDENGQAVYSQFGPPDGRESELVKPPPPPAESPEVARQRLQERQHDFDDTREDKAFLKRRIRSRARRVRGTRKRCEAARQNLEVLSDRSRQLYRTPDGKVFRMSEEERQKKRAAMEKIIAADCR